MVLKLQMKLYKITKGNFCLDETKDIFAHENNLRFHVEIDGKFYEYAIDCINRESINVRCAVVKTKLHSKCYARFTFILAECLKTEVKPSNAKKTKFKWSQTNVETDYLDVRNFTVKPHVCSKTCSKGCKLKHSCPGFDISRDRKRRHIEEARNYSINYPTRSVNDAISFADACVGFGRLGAVKAEKTLSGVFDPRVKRSCYRDRNNWVNKLYFLKFFKTKNSTWRSSGLL